MTLKKLTVIALFAAAAMPASGVLAQQIQLPPDLMYALNELYGAASNQCGMGNQQGCDYAQTINGYAFDLSGALRACQMNDPQACQYYQSGVQEVSMIYQQYSVAMSGMQGGGMTSGGMTSGGTSTFDTQTMTNQHNQTMSTMQNQFSQQNSNWAAQQNQIDQAHQNFMSTLQ